MLTDTHCHINMMVKKDFDIALTREQVQAAEKIIAQAEKDQVSTIINVGTSLTESYNCVELAKWYKPVYATVGIHPNDCTDDWQLDFAELQKLVLEKDSNKIVGIGEIGLDRHYKDYNLNRQKDAFRAQIELALSSDLAIVIHSRDAYDETLRVLEEYYQDISRAVMHCFSYDLPFAKTVIDHGFMLGIGGTITYPKNDGLRATLQTVGLDHIVLETDAPFLPIQEMRGQENHPQYIKNIAEFIAQLIDKPFDAVAKKTTANAAKLFQAPSTNPPIFKA